MIEIDGKEYRNLQEQVLRNQQDIKYILEEQGVLNEFGIKVVGQVSTPEELPEAGVEYGDAIAVGTEPPYTLYVWTRAFSGETAPFWFNIGIFPGPSTVPGPTGPAGPEGTPGQRGSLWVSGDENPPGTFNEGDQFLDTLTGNVYQYQSGQWSLTGNIKGPQGNQGDIGPQGPQGPTGVGATGPRGPQGEPGLTYKIMGTLTSVDQLPTPEATISNNAYIITESTGNFLYIIVGDSTYSWINAGQVSVISPNFTELRFNTNIGGLSYSEGVATFEGSLTYATSENPTEQVIDASIEIGIEAGTGIVINTDDTNTNLKIEIDYLSLYPVGTVLIRHDNISPASLYGGTWENLPGEYALWLTGESVVINNENEGIDASGQIYRKRPAGLPNIKGQWWSYSYSNQTERHEAVTTYAETTRNLNIPTVTGGKVANDRKMFDASTYNAIYGNSATVQPSGYRVYAWRRIS